VPWTRHPAGPLPERLTARYRTPLLDPTSAAVLYPAGLTAPARRRSLADSHDLSPQERAELLGIIEQATVAGWNVMRTSGRSQLLTPRPDGFGTLFPFPSRAITQPEKRNASFWALEVSRYVQQDGPSTGVQNPLRGVTSDEPAQLSRLLSGLDDPYSGAEFSGGLCGVDHGGVQ
jgi:hypothetical protein